MSFKKYFSLRSRNLGRELELAIAANRVAAVSALLAEGADPNAFGVIDDRSRPLHKAVTCAGLPVIEALLSAGANPLLPKEFGGLEFSLLECAQAAERPANIIERVKQAEMEALQKFGVPPALRKHRLGCSSRRRL